MGRGDTAGAITAPTATTSATLTSVPGSYAVSLSGGSAGNYTLIRVDGLMTIVRESKA